MSKLIPAIALASALSFIPSFAFAEVSIADTLDVDSAFSVDVPLSLDMNDVAIERGAGPCPGGCGGPGPGPRPGHHPPPPPPPHARPHMERHYHTTTVVRSRPVVVVEQPSTVVVSEPVQTTSSSSSSVGSILGFGVRGVGYLQSSTMLDNGDCLKSEINGGAGYYIKFRPVRYLSIEFVNDVLFGKYKDYEGSYVRVPVSLGLRGHVFDYGAFDLYGVAAASVTFVSQSDGYNSFYSDYNYDDTHYALFGGQFGAGISFITGGFEIGLDARYTIEQAAENSIVGYVDQSKLVHGLLFSLNLGFAL